MKWKNDPNKGAKEIIFDTLKEQLPAKYDNITVKEVFDAIDNLFINLETAQQNDKYFKT